MKNTLKKLFSLALIALLQIWMVGCYSSEILHSPYESTDGPLSVETKDGQQYQLATWKVLPDGSLEGKGGKKINSWALEPFSGTIPAGSIKAVSVNRLSFWKTTLLVVGVGLAFGLLFHAATYDFPTEIRIPWPQPTSNPH